MNRSQRSPIQSLAAKAAAIPRCTQQHTCSQPLRRSAPCHLARCSSLLLPLCHGTRKHCFRVPLSFAHRSHLQSLANPSACLCVTRTASPHTPAMPAIANTTLITGTHCWMAGHCVARRGLRSLMLCAACGCVCRRRSGGPVCAQRSAQTQHKPPSQYVVHITRHRTHHHTRISSAHARARRTARSHPGTEACVVCCVVVMRVQCWASVSSVRWVR